MEIWKKMGVGVFFSEHSVGLDLTAFTTFNVNKPSNSFFGL